MSDVLDLADFDRAEQDGLVARKDKGGLSIYTYTPLCNYKRLWTPVTRAARGIIFDRASGSVVARPFDKFFNLGEMPETAPEALPAGEFAVEEKLDGSLAILYHHAGRWDVSTKGAFDSPQAQYCRERLLPRYDFSCVPEGWTVLAEMIYPSNRIVVDYQGREALILLAAIETQSGIEIDRRELPWLAKSLGMERVAEHHHRNLLELPFQENAEGYVVRFEGGLRVKVKSPRYVQIHRLLCYRSPRRVLELIEAGEFEAVRELLPEEFMGEFDDIAATLRFAAHQFRVQALELFAELGPLAGERKAFALEVQARAPVELRPALFALLDGKPLDKIIWKRVKEQLRPEPEGDLE